MNGKRAKDIYRTARNILLSVGVSEDEGKGQYRQAINCNSWEPIVIDNKIMRDPDTGMPMMKPKLNPGTVLSEYKLRLFYRFLKRLYNRERENYHTILAETVMEMRRQWKDNQRREYEKAQAKGV